MKDTKGIFQIKGEEIESNPDVRAFIYQQLNELSPFMLPDTQAGVLIHKDEARKPDYRVTLFLRTDEGQIEATSGHEANIFDATREAKDLLLKKVSAFHDMVVSSRERDLEIHEAMKPTQLH